MKKLKISVIGVSLLVPFLVQAHPGLVDKNGCHVCTRACEDRYHVKEGAYHCHVGDDRMKSYTYEEMKAMKGETPNTSSAPAVMKSSKKSAASVATVERAKKGNKPRK